MEDVEIVGTCDLQEDKLEETCNRYSISERFTDYHQMLEQLHPDAVYIIMPPHHLPTQSRQWSWLTKSIGNPGRPSGGHLRRWRTGEK